VAQRVGAVTLEGGAASGSDDDPDQASVDRTMAGEGRAEAKREDETDPVGG